MFAVCYVVSFVLGIVLGVVLTLLVQALRDMPYGPLQGTETYPGSFAQLSAAERLRFVMLTTIVGRR